VYVAGWIFLGTCAVLAALLALSARTASATPAETAALAACDGCTAYLEQIRRTVDLLEEIDASQQVNPRSG
jgi:hypothetical protein